MIKVCNRLKGQMQLAEARTVQTLVYNNVIYNRMVIQRRMLLSF